MHLTPEIATFVRVLELGTFAAVANETGYTSSGISRMISRLEHSLATKLLHRSTRQLSLTPEGKTFLAYAQTILSTVEAAEADISKTMGQPRGHLRVNCGTAFAHHRLAPALPDFINAYPDISIEISVGDRRIDPITDQVDITIRVGALADSDLIAVQLGSVKRIIAASPCYISVHGLPTHPSDLANHNCLLLSGFPLQACWPFHVGKNRVEIAAKGSVASDSAEALLHAAIAGAGIIRLGDFLGADALASGQLVPLLTDCHDDEPQPINALVLPGRQSIPKIRAFISFLKSQF